MIFLNKNKLIVMNTGKEVEILIAEDDDGHAELIITGLKKSGIYNNIVRFSDGEECWNFLLNSLNNSDLDQKTYLLLLDINMPLMDGIEVLSNIKNNKDLKYIPVIMLTTTDNPREIEACYGLGCNVYVTKPVDFGNFAETLNRMGMFIQIIRI